MSQFIRAQKSFYDVYNEICKMREAYVANYERTKDTTLNKDTLLWREQNSPELKEHYRNVSRHAGKVIGLGFPDITFTDLKENSYTISDFKGEVVINYNYPYCMKCIDRIDSTELRTDKKGIKVLVLFAEIYKRDVSFLRMFNQDYVLLGFIGEDTKKLISLTQGEDVMFFLDENHRIEFYDNGDDKNWMVFLDKRLK